MSSFSSNKKQLCVVFDIDETLIQFIPKKYVSLWDGLSEEMKSKFRKIDSNGSIILLRPNIAELFDYYKNNNIRVALWTYSEREYSEGISKILIRELSLPEDFFLFTWGSEDIDASESGMAKDLTDVYRAFPNFNTFNTFLVDDAYRNLYHTSNQHNCILIQPFAPFGVDKVRVDIGEEAQSRMSQDTIFTDLMEISKKVLSDITNCDDEDIEYAFTTEPVFSEKRVKRMGLTNYFKEYAVSFVNMLTIGTPHTSNKFVMINNDVAVHGGGRSVVYRRRTFRKRTNRRPKYTKRRRHHN